MNSTAFSAIENQFSELPFEEQLLLIERLVHRLRNNALGERSAWESDLAAMAADAEIQSELRRIDAEFRSTEAGGLENDRCLFDARKNPAIIQRPRP
jgi:hypothetical protein